MERGIVGFELDAQGEWVAELVCGHRRHVRHDPPLFPQPWVLEAEGRQRHLGAPLECRICEQQGGEAACLANQICPGCGVVLDGSPHRESCSA